MKKNLFILFVFYSQIIKNSNNTEENPLTLFISFHKFMHYKYNHPNNDGFKKLLAEKFKTLLKQLTFDSINNDTQTNSDQNLALLQEKKE